MDKIPTSDFLSLLSYTSQQVLAKMFKQSIFVNYFPN